MVKRQKEKQYQTTREHRASSQRQAAASSSSSSSVQRRLPFSHCALTLTPYETPVCNKIGIVFDAAAIMPFLLQHKMDPVTGSAPMTSRDLIELNMDKNEEGAWQCPILTKPFSDHSKIVAILQPNKATANVYSYEAYHELNVKPKNYEDLVSGAEFDPKRDVLVLYDPNNDELNKRRDINSFYHVKHARELEQQKDQSNNNNVRHSVTATRIMEKLAQTNKNKQAASAKRKAENIEQQQQQQSSSSIMAYYKDDGKRLKVLAQDVTGVRYSEAQSASSLTSTSVRAVTSVANREATDAELLQAQCNVMRQRPLKGRKGCVRLCTNLGDLMLELHCDMVPRTCINFLGLCQQAAYDNTVFHRLIPNFMIQGGGTAGGGDGQQQDDKEEQSLWGGAFADEFDDRLTHTGPGVLSMANAGANTNRRQFFITFKSCNHLDKKHSVFGSVIDGMDVLKKMERVPTDKKDRPRQEIKILGTDVLVDPAKEARELEQKRLEKLVAARETATTATDGGTSSNANAKKSPKDDIQQVGRYLKDQQPKAKVAADAEASAEAAAAAIPSSRLPPPPPHKTTFGDFSGW